MRPQHPVDPAVGVAGGVAEREPRRLAGGLHALAQLEVAGEVGRERLEARLVHRADAIVQRAAGGAVRQRDPAVALLAVFQRDLVPAAIFCAEILGDFGHVDQLFAELERIVERAEDDVRPGAGVGGDRGLRADVVPALGIDADLHAGRLAEGFGVLDERVVLGLDELLPAQHAQARAGFRRRALPGDIGGPRRARQQAKPRRGSTNLQNIAPCDVGHFRAPPSICRHAGAETPPSREGAIIRQQQSGCPRHLSDISAARIGPRPTGSVRSAPSAARRSRSIRHPPAASCRSDSSTRRRRGMRPRPPPRTAAPSG